MLSNNSYTSSDSNELNDFQDKVLNQIKKNNNIDFSNFECLKDQIRKSIGSNSILKDILGI